MWLPDKILNKIDINFRLIVERRWTILERKEPPSYHVGISIWVERYFIKTFKQRLNFQFKERGKNRILRDGNRGYSTWIASCEFEKWRIRGRWRNSFYLFQKEKALRRFFAWRKKGTSAHAWRLLGYVLFIPFCGEHSSNPIRPPISFCYRSMSNLLLFFHLVPFFLCKT